MPNVSNEQLLVAAMAGGLSVLKEWKNQNEGVDINRVTDRLVGTPLHVACFNGQLECVEYLIESCNVDANCKADNGRTPLHTACMNGCLECVKYLIESCNVDANCKDSNGDTPLHVACFIGQLENVKYLIEFCNVDANCKANNGDTPLHEACFNGRYDFAEYLIESSNADIDIKNNNDKTPLDMIRAEDQIDMMRSTMKRLSRLSRHKSQLQRQLEQNEQEKEQLRQHLKQHPRAHSGEHKQSSHMRTNINISHDRRTAVLIGAKTDITFLCGQDNEQQPIKANSGVLLVTVPSIQPLIDSGIQHQSAIDGAPPIQTTIPLPDLQPKHVQHVLECIYAGEISFDDSPHDNTDGSDLPTPILNGRDDLRQLILVANEFGFWRLKLVLEAELVRKHLTQDTMIDELLFGDQHKCALLKRAAMRMIAANMQNLLVQADSRKLIQQPQLLGEIQTLCNGGAVSNGLDDEYTRMSMIEFYKIVDEDKDTSQMDSYLDWATSVDFAFPADFWLWAEHYMYFFVALSFVVRDITVWIEPKARFVLSRCTKKRQGNSEASGVTNKEE